MRSPQRNRRLQFEVMESREVLSASLAGASLAPPALVSLPSIPIEFAPPPLEGEMAVSLTTDHSLYQLGQPIHITLTETNISSHDVMVILGQSRNVFEITHNGALVWSSTARPVSLFLRVETLKPGQSFTVQATWDGMPNVGPPTERIGPFVFRNEPTGVFVVHSDGSTATFTVVPK
jgi:hypothetical protein